MIKTDWNIYRTRFLVKAKQLTEPVSFTDALGRHHSGVAGDYLIESCDGSRRIAPRQIFEDVYVPMRSTVSARHRGNWNEIRRQPGQGHETKLDVEISSAIQHHAS